MECLQAEWAEWAEWECNICRRGGPQWPPKIEGNHRGLLAIDRFFYLTVYYNTRKMYYMNDPITVRMTPKERRLLKKVTKAKTTAEAVKKLLYDEVERQGQIELGKKIHGRMKPSDFDARLI